MIFEIIWEGLKAVWSALAEVTLTLCDFTVVAVGAILSFIFYMTGARDAMIDCLLLFMIIDYFTGILKSIVLKKLNSKVGYRGLLKKVATLTLIVVAYRLDIVLHMSQITYNIRFVTIAFYLANEGLSILENVSLMGLPIPTQLKEILEQYKENKIDLQKK